MSKNKSKHKEILRKIQEDKRNKIYQYDFPDEPIPGFILAQEFDQIDPADLDIIYTRVAEWHAENPNGVPQYKSPVPYRMFISTRDIMLLYKRSLRWSQVLLQNTRFVLKVRKGEPVTVDQFCKINNLENVEEIREFLQAVDAADLEL